MERLKELEIQFDKILSSQNFVESDLDYKAQEKHLDFIKQVDSINTGALSIYDLCKREHLYYSPKFESVFGWDLSKLETNGHEYSNSLIHPDDLLFIVEAGCYFTSIGLSLSPENRPNIKMYMDYRIKGKDGNYVRVIEQHSILESDINGNIWLALSTLDLSPYTDLNSSLLSRMLDVKTGNLYQFPPPDIKKKNILTMREKEILNLISKGLISKQIADTLFISVNTVNTHRQRIIEKLDVSSTSEAIRYAIDLGLLPAVND